MFCVIDGDKCVRAYRYWISVCVKRTKEIEVKKNYLILHLHVECPMTHILSTSYRYVLFPLSLALPIEILEALEMCSSTTTTSLSTTTPQRHRERAERICRNRIYCKSTLIKSPNHLTTTSPHINYNTRWISRKLCPYRAVCISDEKT